MVPEAIAFLLGSEKRVRVLAAFEDGSRRQASLARDCSVGRSTVHRCVEGFCDHGWLREVEDGYALTTGGRRVLSAYRAFADTVERVCEHETLFRCLDAAGVAVPPGVLDDATVVMATEHDPHAAVVACADLLRRADADRVRTAWTGVSPITNSAGEDHLAEGRRVEMVVDRRTLVAARESYFRNYQLALASDRVDVHVTDDPIEAGVLLAGDRAAVTGYENGRARVCVHGSSDDLRAWAEGVYEDLHDRADPVEVRYPAPGAVEERRATPLPDGAGRLE